MLRTAARAPAAANSVEGALRVREADGTRRAGAAAMVVGEHFRPNNIAWMVGFKRYAAPCAGTFMWCYVDFSFENAFWVRGTGGGYSFEAHFLLCADVVKSITRSKKHRKTTPAHTHILIIK